MTKTLIIEDESYIRKGLIELVNMLDKKLVIIGECESVQDAITVTKATQPELIFLDINLPDGDAFDFLEQTNQFDYKVIFITAHEKYALKALKQGAVDYILKPVDIEELEIAIDKALVGNPSTQKQRVEKVQKLWNSDQDKLILSLQDSFKVIHLNELTYCMSDKGYTTFYLKDGQSIMASKPLKEFEPRLLSSEFIRTHQSYLVNLNYIDRYDKQGYVVILKSGQEIPVSTRKKDDFLTQFLS